MLNFKTKFKAGEFGGRLFDNEAWEGCYGKLVRVDPDGVSYYYTLDLLDETPTEAEQATIVDEVDTMFYDHLHNCDNEYMLENPTKKNFERENLYWFNIT